MRGELELDEARVDAPVCDDDDLRRPARQVDRDVTRDGKLRLVHVGVAGADDLVDLAHVGEPADRLRPADPERGCSRGDEACALWRGANDQLPDSRDLRRHSAHDEGRDEIPGDVDADALER